MVVKKIAMVVVLMLSLALYGIPVHAGMHGGMKSGDQSEMSGDHTEKGHMMKEGHGKAMSGHGSMGEDLFSGSAFGINVKGSMVDVKAQMAKMGKDTSSPTDITHHLMLTPEKPLGKETSANVAITYPDGTEREVKLTAMGNHIGGDLNLDKKGKYSFNCTVTKGQEKASFEFEYEVK